MISSERYVPSAHGWNAHWKPCDLGTAFPWFPELDGFGDKCNSRFVVYVCGNGVVKHAPAGNEKFSRELENVIPPLSVSAYTRSQKPYVSEWLHDMNGKLPLSNHVDGVFDNPHLVQLAIRQRRVHHEIHYSQQATGHPVEQNDPKLLKRDQEEIQKSILRGFLDYRATFVGSSVRASGIHSSSPSRALW